MSKLSTVVLLLVACAYYSMAQNPGSQRLIIVRSTNKLGDCLNYRWQENLKNPKTSKLIASVSFRDNNGNGHTLLLHANPKDNSAPPFFSTNVFNVVKQTGEATQRVLKIDNDGTTVKYTFILHGAIQKVSCGYIRTDNASTNREPTPKQKQAILKKCSEKGMQDVSQINCNN